ncbi:unnamed protein product [Ostreobium quekettii]|uniref:Globin n=1 Tax=Ostreobium quekettii TaxID=121088 RepID=A0A8S1J0Y9_9CHLO|nr:unnamed protein product [Ostreobium quekettii]|eukprot:evm.model.scf_492.2 EVM.evm.TU.scf_492.2   scf_492:41430-45982(+)
MGEQAIFGACEAFYKKCYSDDRIKHWFQGISPNTMAKKMTAFACYAFGGDEAYAGRDLAEAHAGLVKRGMGDYDFDVVVELFVEALKEGKVPDEMIGEIGAIVGQLRDPVLGRLPRMEGVCPYHSDSGSEECPHSSGSGSGPGDGGHEATLKGNTVDQDEDTQSPIRGSADVTGDSSNGASQNSMGSMRRHGNMVLSPITDLRRPDEELVLSPTSDMHSNEDMVLSPGRDVPRHHNGFHSPTPEVHRLYDGFRSPPKEVHRPDDRYYSKSRDAYSPDERGGGPSKDMHRSDGRLHNQSGVMHEPDGRYNDPSRDSHRPNDRYYSSEGDAHIPGEIGQDLTGEVYEVDGRYQAHTSDMPRPGAGYRGTRDTRNERPEGWTREGAADGERNQTRSQDVYRPPVRAACPMAGKSSANGGRGSANGGVQGLRSSMHRSAERLHSSSMRRQRVSSPVPGMRTMGAQNTSRGSQNSQESMTTSDERYFSPGSEIQRSGERYGAMGSPMQRSSERHVDVQSSGERYSIPGSDLQSSDERYHRPGGDRQRQDARFHSPSRDMRGLRDRPTGQGMDRGTGSRRHGASSGRQGASEDMHRRDERVHRPDEGVQRAPTGSDWAPSAQGGVDRTNDGMYSVELRVHNTYEEAESADPGMYYPRQDVHGLPRSPYGSRQAE